MSRLVSDFPISLTRAGRQAIRSAGMITIPTLYQRLGGGGVANRKGVLGGGGGVSGQKDKPDTDDQQVPNHAVYIYMSKGGLHKIIFGMDLMNFRQYTDDSKKSGLLSLFLLHIIHITVHLENNSEKAPCLFLMPTLGMCLRALWLIAINTVFCS
jgi:hypothetical protein